MIARPWSSPWTRSKVFCRFFVICHDATPSCRCLIAHSFRPLSTADLKRATLSFSMSTAVSVGMRFLPSQQTANSSRVPFAEQPMEMLVY